jgi:large subunit ribosomal protein L23
MFYTIKRPLISEKNSMHNELGIYTFEVDKKASKPEIKAAVEKMFRVKVKAVRTSVCRARTKKNKYGESAVKYWKKALVQLKPGEKIAIFEGA